MLSVVLSPKPLNSMAEICEAFGRGRKKIKAWCAQGAPIAVEGDRYSAEYNTLHAWLVWHTQEKQEAGHEDSRKNYS